MSKLFRRYLVAENDEYAYPRYFDTEAEAHEYVEEWYVDDFVAVYERVHLIDLRSHEPPSTLPGRDGWTAWTGGRRPVRGGQLVEVVSRGARLKDGAYAPPVKLAAADVRWEHDQSDDDVVAYRTR